MSFYKYFNFSMFYSSLFLSCCLGMEENNKENVKIPFRLSATPSPILLNSNWFVEEKPIQENFTSDSLEEIFQRAQNMLKEAPHDALGLLLSAEKRNHKESNKILDEIRKSKEYQEPKTSTQDSLGYLLNQLDPNPSNKYDTALRLWGSQPNTTIDYLFDLANNENTPKKIKTQSLKQLEKIRKSNAYKKANTTISDDIGYYLYQKDKNQGNISSKGKQSEKKVNNKRTLRSPSTTELCNQGIAYYNVQNYKEAVPLLEKAATQGNAQAKNLLANMYHFGTGVAKDEDKALKYLNDSADLGFLPALNTLGNIYLQGDSVEKNIEKAIGYYERAGKLGDARALNNLGNIYFQGKGIEKNIDKAVGYYERAGELGNARALNNLGGYYKDKGEYKTACNYFQRAADKELPEGSYNLGVMCENGLGINKDPLVAYAFYNQAATLGCTQAKAKIDDHANQKDKLDDLVNKCTSLLNHGELVNQAIHSDKISFLPGADDELKSRNSSPQLIIQPEGEENPVIELPSNIENKIDTTTFSNAQPTGNLLEIKDQLPDQSREEGEASQAITEPSSKDKTIKSPITRRKSLNPFPPSSSDLSKVENIEISASHKPNTNDNRPRKTLNRAQSLVNMTRSPRSNVTSEVTSVKEKRLEKSQGNENKPKKHKAGFSNQKKYKVVLKKQKSDNDLKGSDSQSSFSESESERSEGNTQPEKLFQQEGTRDKDLHHLKKLLNKKDLIQPSDVKLDRSSIIRVLRELGLNGQNIIDWKFENNKITATHKMNQNICFVCHVHNKPGTGLKWYQNKDIITSFLTFIRQCNTTIDEIMIQRFEKNKS